MNKNDFLDIVGKSLHNERMKFPLDSSFTMRIDRHQASVSAEIYFQTRGCRHSYQGGCTMCYYWTSDPVATEQMVASVEDALNALGCHPDLLIIGPFGNMFDDWEVPPKARRKIFTLLSKLSGTKFAFETRADTVSEDKISECASILQGHRVEIELGLESADFWISKYCINKSLKPEEVLDAVQIIKKYDLFPVANILIGAPFLTFPEMVTDAVSSIKWAFTHGFGRCVVFPINVKPWTLVSWLRKSGMYTPPPLWALVEVLYRLDPMLLRSTEIVWYKTQVSYSADYQPLEYCPTTCPNCYDDVIQLLDEYRYGQNNRSQVVKQLVELQCDCKDEWCDRLEIFPVSSLHSRVQTAYQVIGEQILGAQWWAQYGDRVIASIADCSQLV